MSYFILHFKEPSVQFSNSLLSNIWQTPYITSTVNCDNQGTTIVEGEILTPEVWSLIAIENPWKPLLAVVVWLGRCQMSHNIDG